MKDKLDKNEPESGVYDISGHSESVMTDTEYNLEENSAQPDNGGHNNRKRHRNPILLLLNMMVSPRVGWRAIKRARLTPEQACAKLFYPAIGLASISNFAHLLYATGDSLVEELTNAIITFSSFFFAYYLLFIFAKLLLKKASAEIITDSFGKVFVAFSSATLCLFYILYCCLPMLEPLIVLFPLWTVFVIFRGIRILRIPKNEESGAAVRLSVLIVGLPIGVGYLFSLILP